MVVHHRRLREPGWRPSMAINAVGAVTTGMVALVVVVSKFTEGAYLPAFVIAALVLLFRGINKHYSRLEGELQIEPADAVPINVNHTIIVLVGSIHKGVLSALAYAQSLHPQHLVAVHVASTQEEQERIHQQWESYRIDVPLEIVYSQYRELSGPVLRYIDELDARWHNDTVTVIIPEFVVRKWWEQILHNQSALVLKGKLLFRPNVAVLSLPYHVGRLERA
jgi:hypothetical protein